jgi:hypothetical protein
MYGNLVFIVAMGITMSAGMSMMMIMMMMVRDKLFV